MADSTRYSNTDDDTGASYDRESPPGIPRWVKAFGIALLVLALLVVIIMLTGVGGPHGPGRHLPFGGHTPPASIIAPVVQQL